MKKNNKIWQAFFTLVILELLFTALSFYDVDIQKIDFIAKSGYKFYSFSELVNFDVPHANVKVDSIIDYLLNDKSKLFARRKLFNDFQYKKNIHLLNPINNYGSYALDLFFDALVNVKDSCLVRIAHYGDSQLEGDRITHVLRQKFQNKFGGSGPGFIPFTDIASPVVYSRTTNGNWCRFNVFSNKYSSDLYGPAGTLFKFNNCNYQYKKSFSNDSIKDEIDSTYNFWLTANEAGINIKLKSQSYYKKISVMYGNSVLPCAVDIYDNENHILMSDTLPESKWFNLFSFHVLNSPNYIKINFNSEISPDFYGLLMDSYNGVQVDNYAIRGHSGGGLLKINQAYLASQFKVLNTKLIIFQYGGNVVPYVNDSTDLKNLESLYYSLFSKFKKVAPNSAILVISTGDMSRKQGELYVSYSQIPQIVEVQKNAALKANCAFWDLYSTMGGENSIRAWAAKGLASPDGHFAYRGQQIIGDELFKAIMAEYNSYQARKRKFL